MTPGPVPKRSDQRIRRNTPDIETETIEMVGEVEIPDLGLADPSPLVEDFYYSLAESGQAKFYEPSDWEFARIMCHFLDREIKSFKPNGQILSVLHSMMTDLLVAEGARRRVRLEIEREQAKAQIYDVADRFREMMN